MQRIQKIKKAERELKTINKELNTFIYKASHDLKGPLASIIGLANIAIEDLDSLSPEKVLPAAQEYLSLVRESAKILENNLSNLIEVTYLKQTGQQKEVIDFEGLIRSIFDSLKHIEGYGMVNLKLDIKQETPFKADPKLLKSTLQNLVENALKYRDPKVKRPFVEVYFRQKKTKDIIRISDNGVGIPKEYHKKIFDMFFRANQGSSGSGLGLYLVKNSVEKMGGEISIESIGRGTVFTIELNK